MTDTRQLDTKQEREEFQSLAWNSDKVPPSVCRRIDRLCEMVDELQARYELECAGTKSKLERIQSLTQERDALAERVKALECPVCHHAKHPFYCTHDDCQCEVFSQ